MRSKAKMAMFIALSMVLLQGCKDNKMRVLVFSKTAGFRHESIKAGKNMFLKLGEVNQIKVDTSEDASYFMDENLKQYNAIVFLSTTGDILNYSQQVALERFVQSGGGFVGIHAATDTEYGWPWYVQMVGGSFESHPKIQEAKINILENKHPSTAHLPKVWQRTDEWYNFKSLNPSIKVLATIDETSYEGGKLGNYHPMVWYHDYDGGRAFYTEFGHTDESYTEEKFVAHVLGGIKYAIGEGQKPDYAKARSQYRPDQSRFHKQVIKEGLDEPIAMAITNGGEVFYCERKGKVYYFDPKSGIVKLAADVPVESYAGSGIMGMTLDPDYDYNKIIYLFYIDINFTYKLSSFKFVDKKIVLSTEKVIFSFPIQKEPGAHNGGSLVFDKDGNLLIATGDNTPPWQANGFPPYDQREGRELYDAQRTASNSNDLRGKILRIKPNATRDGYTIPEGNLFAENTPLCRPEIYIMGCRNPWKMSYDKKTNYVYWGEVGPDAHRDSTIGTKAYDELNQARKAGYFGWPYFIATNKPYAMVDLVNEKPGPMSDPLHVVNNSKNNTGIVHIPFKPKEALIYYPYDQSFEFPEVGVGGRTICAGPVYDYNTAKNSQVKFPAYYNGKLFIFDWMRDWIKAVTLDKGGNYVGMEPVVENFTLAHPSHIMFAPNGSMYVLEYGYLWYAQSANARLSCITFHEGNRPPEAKISFLTDTIGIEPFTLTMTASLSTDPDGDSLSFEWSDGDLHEKKGKQVSFQYDNEGVYWAKLIAKDKNGATSQTLQRVIVGNTYPKVNLVTSNGNKSFYWANTALTYKAEVSDSEDRIINPENINVVLNYLNEGEDMYPLPDAGHTATKAEKSITDNALIAASDCKACHALNNKSVGPAFVEIAKRYANDGNAPAKLAKKIINGGAGNWGEHAMSAHPQITLSAAKEMVSYILQLATESDGRNTQILPGTGAIPASVFANKKGTFYLTVTYEDNGKDGKGKLKCSDIIRLGSPKMELLDADTTSGCMPIYSEAEGFKNKYCGAIAHNSFMVFKRIDLTSVGSILARTNSKSANGKFELRIDKLDGEVIASIPVKAAGAWEKWTESIAELKATRGVHKLYFVFVNKRGGIAEEVVNFDWLQFNESKPFVATGNKHKQLILH